MLIGSSRGSIQAAEHDQQQRNKSSWESFSTAPFPTHPCPCLHYHPSSSSLTSSLRPNPPLYSCHHSRGHAETTASILVVFTGDTEQIGARLHVWTVVLVTVQFHTRIALSARPSPQAQARSPCWVEERDWAGLKPLVAVSSGGAGSPFAKRGIKE